MLRQVVRAAVRDALDLAGLARGCCDLMQIRADQGGVSLRRAIAADLQRNGVTEDELNRAKQPILTNVRESARTNTYCGNTLGISFRICIGYRSM